MPSARIFWTRRIAVTVAATAGALTAAPAATAASHPSGPAHSSQAHATQEAHVTQQTDERSTGSVAPDALRTQSRGQGYRGVQGFNLCLLSQCSLGAGAPAEGGISQVQGGNLCLLAACDIGG
ncbi:hypothetical protein MMF93_32830 [Streptomyces tubbatahanensis]|uniref:Uncharacterized protein n=1 Tax=Streptomyces tubbatahanensis TaxID=2923272 RepID=A0ABY3Y2C4_9ACTN|nr:hypothetical protein [Streptomyces tubbatahanensis]UNT00737.1 hypothetical protein MMF93_32830 [Streptomyces tubbatahanensis]